jgi:serine/threonine protein kinase
MGDPAGDGGPPQGIPPAERTMEVSSPLSLRSVVDEPSPLSQSFPGAVSRQLLAERYELLGLVGVGGMGSVYRARDVELDEIVALKVLRRELVDTPGILDRFRREVKLARRVTHRNVARVFDIGEHGGEKFLTMEFIDGEPLGSILARDGAMRVARVLELAAGVCAGLASAHAAGVVHRDLKPDNVLLAKDGRVVVTDFGIARAFLDAAAGLGNTLGVLMGTPAYMAPEQVEGRKDIDARADIYALGALLYELFTGRRAWEGESPFAVASARLTSLPPDPRQRRPDLPSAHAEVVMRCMARKPEERFQSVDDVAHEIVALSGRAPRRCPRSGRRTRRSTTPPPRATG